MIKALTLKELGLLIKRINHSHFLKGRNIKYAYMSFDFRTNEVFNITFRTFSGLQKEFTTVNRYIYDKETNNFVLESNLPERLEIEILNWLKEAENDAIRSK